MPADILLFALIAAGLIFWLKSILGTRDEDHDSKKRSSMFSDDQDNNVLPNPLKPKKAQDGKVVALNIGLGDKYVLPAHVRIDNKTTENNIDDIIKDIPSFDLEHFVQGAEGAFGMIIEAFADGDAQALENLLAPEVFESFKAAIEERKKRGETVETQIKNVEKMDITQARIDDGHIFMTVRFSAREICIIRDKAGEIISGDPDVTTTMVDVWVFGRSLDSKGPEWYLYETRDDEAEDHKTPIPEGGSDKEKK